MHWCPHTYIKQKFYPPTPKKKKKREREKPELKESFSSFASITPATSSALILQQQDANNYKILMWKIKNKIIKFNNEPHCAG